MRVILRNAMAVAALAISTQAAAEVVLYQNNGFQGQSLTAESEVRDLDRTAMNGRANSAVVLRGQYEVCEDSNFRGRCMILRPGKYPSLAAMALVDRVSSVRAVSADTRVDNSRYAPTPVVETPSAAPIITFYENEGFRGRSFETTTRVGNLERSGFSDRASSVVVIGERWEVCEDLRFRGRCTVLHQGRYPSLTAMGLNDRVSSVRWIQGNTRIDDNRYAPAPVPVYDNRRRRNERLYEANVTSVRAIAGTPQQRCWMEKEAVPQEKSNVSIPGALIGAVLGGVLGHQIGSGSGNTAATVGGAVLGGAAGSQVGRLGIGNKPAEMRDVQKCDTAAAQTAPDHWDVTYDFRGQQHTIQTTTPPGPTVTVNERGEPRTARSPRT